jgi:hypothetical protein
MAHDNQSGKALLEFEQARRGAVLGAIIHDHQLDRHTELERAQALDYACNPVFLVVRGYNEADSLCA